MTKTKIAFAGFMGAILMSVGAANAATTSIATKGYVDSLAGEQGSLTKQVEALEAKAENAVTANDLKDYELTANKVESMDGITGDALKTKYPTVGAVKAALPDLEPSQIEELKKLAENESIKDLSGLVSKVDTLTGTGEDSIAGKIASAISEHNTAADGKYQAQSTAAYSVGNKDGGWTELTPEEQLALKSGITADMVRDYDEAIGDGGTVAQLQTAVDELTGTNGTIAGIQGQISDLDEAINDKTNGLKTIVGEHTGSIEDNGDAIKALEDEINGTEGNPGLKAQILDKITNPPEKCQSESGACVLMIENNDISWVEVTKPLESESTQN